MTQHFASLCAVMWVCSNHAVFADSAGTLRAIAEKQAANDSRLRTLVAEYDVVDRTLGPSVDPNDRSHVQRVTESTVRVWLRHVEGLIRVGYEEKAGTRKLDEAGEELIKEYPKEEHRYLKTPEHFVRFPVNERRVRVNGFPDVAGFGPGRRGRVLYLDPTETSERYGRRSRFFDPRLVYSNGSHQFRRFCSLYADALDGLRTDREQSHASSNLEIEERRDGCIVVAVKYGGGILDTETVFDPTLGYQATSFLSRKNGKTKEELVVSYAVESGVYVPDEIQMTYHRGDSKGRSTRHFKASKLSVNSKIDDQVFAVSALDPHYGDRMADSVTGALKIWAGERFVGHEQFKMDHSRMPWGKQ